MDKIKCEVLVDAISLVVGKGSVVELTERQYELVRAYVRPIDAVEKKTKKKEK